MNSVRCHISFKKVSLFLSSHRSTSLFITLSNWAMILSETLHSFRFQCHFNNTREMRHSPRRAKEEKNKNCREKFQMEALEHTTMLASSLLIDDVQVWKISDALFSIRLCAIHTTRGSAQKILTGWHLPCDRFHDTTRTQSDLVPPPAHPLLLLLLLLPSPWPPCSSPPWRWSSPSTGGSWTRLHTQQCRQPWSPAWPCV